jgi:predicted aminopeptidase
VAESLRGEGLDVCVVPVTAYSTLGWLDDPITTPMLRRGNERLVETVLHELVHSTVYVPSQPDFNEGVARFIGQEASVRFFETDAERERVADDRRIAAAMLAFREDVAALYAQDLAPDVTVGRRDVLESKFRESLRTLPVSTRDPTRLADSLRLNDACLAIRGTYASDDHRHEQLLTSLGGDLPRFVERLRDVADSDDPRAAFFTDPEPEPSE